MRRRRLGIVCVLMLAAAAVISAVGAGTAQALPTCESTYKPTEVKGSSNAASALTAVTVRWKIPAAVEKELVEQVVNVWVSGEARSDGRKVADKTISARSFVFNNKGEKGEESEGTEAVFIEPHTAYSLAVKAVYGKSTKYPEGCAVETEGTKAVTTRHIFGTNGGLCCSKELGAVFVKNGETLVKDGIAADRIDVFTSAEEETKETNGNSLALTSEHDFVNNDVIVGNVLDSERLSKVTTATWAKEAREQVERAAKYGNVLMEVGNEMFLKGQCSECAEPAKYAEMFVALSKEVAKAKETKAVPQDVKLLFNLFGDYYLGEGKWSNATEKRGWLGDALTAQPELKTRIEGLTFHPYDVEGKTLAEEEKLTTYEYDYGVRGLKQDYEEAVELGVKHTNVYATEFGICEHKEFEERTCNEKGTAKTEEEDNKEAETDYNELLGSKFAEVKGLWWYRTYPGEDKYSFFKNYGTEEATKLLTLVKELSKKS